MSPAEVSPPITIDALQKFLSTCKSSDLLAFKLTNGDILLGGIPRGGRIKGDTVNIAFNMPDGKRYGQARVVEIPLADISSVERVPLSEESRPQLSKDDPEVDFLKEVGIDVTEGIKLPVHNYPNPLASVIYEHNVPIIERKNFRTLYLIEEALSQDGIPTEGIRFDDDFLLYADWDFFETQSGGGISIAASPLPGLVQIEKSIQMSPEQQVMQRLKLSLGEQFRKSLSPSVGNYAVLHGALLVSDPAQDEEIEGELSYLYQTGSSIDGTLHPILVKARLLKFPRGFLNRVSSELVFYGEVLPIPVVILGITYDKVLLVRALAHLKGN